MPALSPQRWAELSPQLDALLTLPPLARAARLSEIAANDPATAADLQALVREHETGRGFLSGVAEPGLLPGADAGPVAAPAQAGSVLGAWALEAPLAEGGMGSVWRARRSDGRFEGEAAVKLLRTGLFDPRSQERFRREGALLARLHHPGIVPLLDAGVTASGQPFLVLELVHGEPIDRWCRARSLPARERVRLFLQVLEAVAAAHAQLVLHRDLKPSNILVEADGRVRLLDFGIARLLHDDGAEPAEATLTREGELALTPRYAAPEQALGAPLSVATDVYQLGVVLYELLCGAHPSGLAPGAGALEYLRALGTQRPLPPSQRVTERAAAAAGAAGAAVAAGTADVADDGIGSGPAAARSLRGDLDTIVLKALRPAPAERYASVAALADDLRRHLELKPVAARPETFAYLAQRWLQRNRGLAVAAGLAVVAVAAGVAGVWLQAERAREAAARADAARVQAERERDVAEASDEFMAFLLGARGDRPLTAGELLDRGSAMAAAQFADSPELLARLMLTMAQLQFARDDFKRADRDLRIAEQAASAARASGGAAARLAPQAMCLRAADNNFVPDRAKAQAMFAQALAELGAPEAAEVRSSCLSLQAYRAQDDGDPAAGAPLLRQALEALGPNPGPGQRARAAELRMQLAFNDGREGRIADALRALRAGTEELARMGRADTDAGFVRQIQIAQLEVQAGQWAEARKRFIEAMSRTPDTQFAGSRMVTALLVTQMGLHDEAAALLARARAGAAEVGDQQLLAQMDLGYVRCPRGTALATCLQRVQATRQIILARPKPSPSTASVEAAIGLHLLDGGDLAGAAAALARSLAVFDKLPAPRAGRAWVGAWAARVALQRGDIAAARRLADEAVAHARRMDAGFEHNAFVGHALMVQAMVQRAAGERNEARSTADAALRHLEGAAGEVPLTQEARRLVAELAAA